MAGILDCARGPERQRTRFAALRFRKALDATGRQLTAQRRMRPRSGLCRNDGDANKLYERNQCLRKHAMPARVSIRQAQFRE